MSPGNLLTGLGVLIAMGGQAFGLIKWVQSQVSEVRDDAERKMSEARNDHSQKMVSMEAKVEAIRAECARREDLSRLDLGIQGINRRIDEVLALVATRARQE